ncbi:MAG: SufBD protein [Bacillota bacterium]
MLSPDALLSFDKKELPQAAVTLLPEDIGQLVQWLAEKNDDIRYRAFLLLQQRALAHDDVYPYWNVFLEKLKSPNSYQRSIGLMLMAENAKWDVHGKFDASLDLYLSFCDDEKPVTVRQCIQGLLKVIRTGRIFVGL